MMFVTVVPVLDENWFICPVCTGTMLPAFDAWWKLNMHVKHVHEGVYIDDFMLTRKRCAYRNCNNLFPVTRPGRIYCCNAHGKYEYTYRKRGGGE